MTTAFLHMSDGNLLEVQAKALWQKQKQKYSVTSSPIKHVEIHDKEITKTAKDLIAYLNYTGTRVTFTMQDEFDRPLSETFVPLPKRVRPEEYGKHIVAAYSWFQAQFNTMHRLQNTMAELRAIAKENETYIGPKVYNVSEEEERFVRIWAPAYGIDIPRIKETSSECTSFKARYHTKFIRDDIERYITNSNRAEARNRRTLTENIREFHNIYTSLKYYVDNNYEMLPNYDICKMCGSPYNTVSFEEPIELIECRFCGTLNNIYAVETRIKPYVL